MAEGCDDPLVNYYYLSISFDPAGHATNELVKLFLKAAADMSGSSYSEIRKFYSCVRVSDWVLKWDKQQQQQVFNLRMEAKAHLIQALVDKDLPPIEAREACLAMLSSMQVYNAQVYPPRNLQGDGNSPCSNISPRLRHPTLSKAIFILTTPGRRVAAQGWTR